MQSTSLLNEYLPYIFLVIGIGILLYSLFFSTVSNDELKKTGIEVEGVIFELSHENIGSAMPSIHGPIINNKIMVRFVTKEKHEWITASVKQDFALFGNQYKNGDIVKVFYLAKNPSTFYVSTGQSELAGRLIFALIGVAFLCVGLYKLVVNEAS